MSETVHSTGGTKRLVSVNICSVEGSSADIFGAFARIVSPGGRALAYPRATPGLLTHTWFLTRNPNEDDFIGKDQ